VCVVFDTDGSGKISREELKSALSRMGMDISDEELDEMMDSVDTDGDGEIDYREFTAMMTQP